MTEAYPIEKLKVIMDLILQYDKSLFIEKLGLGEPSSDSVRCDLEQIFGMTAYIMEMPIGGLVEKDRASLYDALDRINALFQEINEYDAAVVDAATRLRERIRDRADRLYDITLPWRGLMKFLYEPS